MRVLAILLLLFLSLSFEASTPLAAAAMVVTVLSSNINALVERSLALMESKSPDLQVFIGIAGGPGTGKSTVAERVCNAVNQKIRPDTAIVIPMDGYHISRAELQRMGNQGIKIGDVATGNNKNGVPTTTYQDLMSRRGAPWTFDAGALVRDLSAAKQHGHGSFPIYSRDISDPVPNGVVLNRSHKIVYCEGNYLLSYDNDDWKPLEKIWDDTWYISVPEQVTEERLVNRHLERWNDAKIELWGEGRAGAQAKVEASDLKNFRWIQETSRGHANVIIEN